MGLSSDGLFEYFFWKATVLYFDSTSLRCVLKCTFSKNIYISSITRYAYMYKHMRICRKNFTGVIYFKNENSIYLQTFGHLHLKCDRKRNISYLLWLNNLLDKMNGREWTRNLVYYRNISEYSSWKLKHPIITFQATYNFLIYDT